ncbi:hypothetical protein SAMN02745123_02220 [Desulforamulus aeronauticus DSM 10349]|uniref:Uncharacterized protein n=1 Tax=Desulforamulus aeronauticus DSM 10349 TaxID=1121421 RepID=A0A1M6TAB7_9FIRM|nr:hypothetical protein SAMN02745123_02220 [Desulforamulus aeronauticus DSM 10349]
MLIKNILGMHYKNYLFLLHLSDKMNLFCIGSPGNSVLVIQKEITVLKMTNCIDTKTDQANLFCIGWGF